MFTEKELAEYRSIKAPKELHEAIKNQHNKPKRSFYYVGALAACLALVLAGMLLFRPAGIIVNGQELKDRVVFYHTAPLSERSASSAVSVPIEYRGKGTVKVRVSDGWVSSDGSAPAKELEVSASAIVWWEVDPEEGTLFEMEIATKKSVKKLTLKYEEGKITVSQE